ncbi:MAG TPA: hypothetical protein VGA22_01520 [Gemmatimonadales bacterium]
MHRLFYLIFALSGAAGLMYESVWARYMGLWVGHSAYAQVLVLGIFLGGMALGALLVGARAERIRDPLRLYAIVEIVVGLIGLVFHDVFAFTTTWAYDVMLPAMGPGFAAMLAQWSMAGLLLLPQSLLLGATFPLLAAGMLRRSTVPSGTVLALLYFANGIGASLGVLVAGFWLLGAAGLPGTVVAAGTVNLVVGLVAFALSRPSHAAAGPVPKLAPRMEPVDPRRSRLTRVLVAVSFGTAVASFIYEIAWLRMLSLALGSATHVFEVMLSAFILGLAVGAFWVRRHVDRWEDPVRVLAVVQWLMGLAALATLPAFGASFGWTAWLFETLNRSEGGYVVFNVARYGTALAVMFPSTFLAGITFPLVTRTLYAGGGGIGERAIGTVYGANTLGSITGAGLAGLVLLPLLGLRGLLVSGAVLDMLIGLALLALLATVPSRRLIGALATGTVVAAAWALTAGQVGEARLASGVYRHGNPDVLEAAEMLSYHDGRTATVSVFRDGDLLTIATNGKPDGSLPMSWIAPDRCTGAADTAALRADQATQIVAPLITLAHAAAGARVAVIGHGTGMSAHAVLADTTVRRVTTVEIEPAMVAGSRAFYPANRRVFDDERSGIVAGDARAYFAGTVDSFDVIFSEPSNPWVSGVASLFTLEFYGHVRRRLTDGGAFGQWLHLYELNDGLVMTVLAAIHRTFDDYALFATSPGDILVVAIRGRAASPDWERLAEIFAGRDGCGVVRPSVAELRALQIADKAVFAPLLDGGGVEPNSDYYPVLDLGAQRTFFTKEFAFGIYELATAGFDLSAALSERRYRPLSGVTPFVAGHPRLVSLHRAAFVAADPSTVRVERAQAPFRAARHAWEGWVVRLERDRPPGDWSAWLAEFQTVARARSGGTAGWRDSVLLEATEAFVERHAAPARVRAAVEFEDALQSWDYPRLAAAADAIIAAGEPLDEGLDPTLLLEAAVLAQWRLGRVSEARVARDQLLRRGVVDRSALRFQLLSALVDASERR